LAEALTYRLRFVLPHAFVHLANAYLGSRRFREATEAIKKALSAAERAKDRYCEYNARVMQARLLIARNHHIEAERLLNVDLEKLPMRALQEEFRVTRALALACHGSIHEALALSRRSPAITDLQASTLRVFVKAIAAMHTDGKDAALTDIVTALRLSLETGYVDCFVLAYRGFPAILEELARSKSVENDWKGILRAARDFDLATAAGLRIGEPEDDGSPIHSLSKREFEVLSLLAEGMTNSEIARHLFIAESTAKLHVHHILGKLSVRTRTEAALVATRHKNATQADVR
jgi:DNA-binding NarL/FixJ family response regulator